MEPLFEQIVNSYTKSDELEEFTILLDLQDDPYVKEKIFQLKCQELFQLIDEDLTIPTPEPMYYEDICSFLNETSTTDNIKTSQQLPAVELGPSESKYFRPWEDQLTYHVQSIPYRRSPSPQLLTSRMNVKEHSLPLSPQPGPSGINQHGRGVVHEKPYTYEMKRRKTYAKNKAIDTTYQVKFNDQWKGEKIKDLNHQLHQMFDDILNAVRGQPSDLGRVVVHHQGLQRPIVVPLRPWENLDSQAVLEGISNVLNSNEELIVDDSMSISIGSIDIPSGGAALPITRLFGPHNSLRRKKSIFEVTSDKLCLPISIGLSFIKTCRKVKMMEWNILPKIDPCETILDKAIRTKTCPLSYYKKLLDKSKPTKAQEMGVMLCRKAGVPIDRYHGLNDITPFEKLLDVNINVISSKLGNKFVRVVDNSDLTNLFIYLVELNDLKHFHGISSIAGFFGASFFCETCLKPYAQREIHSCETTCNVCGSKDCTVKNPMSCRNCHRECRSYECYERHHKRNITKKSTLPSMCEKRYRCTICKKVIEREEREPEQHICGEWKCKTCEQYQTGLHNCYHRATAKDLKEKTFLFYDFESRQDEKMECKEGYLPSNQECHSCEEEIERCAKRNKCQNCNQTWCGLYQHVVNFGVLQSSCQKCHNQELTPDSRCGHYGNRCITCSKKDKRKQYVHQPCPTTCGRREHIFSGDDTVVEFCSHIMKEHYKGSILVAHNAKAFDLYPILEVLIDRHAVRPDRIIYNGTKVMYMHIAKKLDLTFVDSLNFIPMKLANFPKAFGLEEMSKGYFPHYFNRKENQEYIAYYPNEQQYGHDYMSSDQRAKFLEWHRSKRKGIFDFRKENVKLLSVRC